MLEVVAIAFAFERLAGVEQRKGGCGLLGIQGHHGEHLVLASVETSVWKSAMFAKNRIV